MSTATAREAIDLSVDVDVLSTPSGGKQDLVAPIEAGGWTTSTTCWSCEFSCGCDDSECFC